MQSKTFNLVLLLAFFACNNTTSPAPEHTGLVNPVDIVSRYATVADIPLPAGFKRVESADNSFAAWLRNVHLKTNNTVYTYDGSMKANQAAQFAVLDISIGDKDLQQCADAVMRMKAEYLFHEQKFSEIIFYDNDHKTYRFEKPYDRPNLHKYLQQVFGMCGSASLSKQLHSVSLNDMVPGDVFIRGGFPGHAVIVMDVAVNNKAEKAYLLAQSYMPAQDIHILVNPVNEVLSPWYLVDAKYMIETPEYLFYRNELKRF